MNLQRDAKGNLKAVSSKAWHSPAPLAVVRLVRSGAWRKSDAVRPVRLAVNHLLERRAEM